jgi:hypothetical protein
MTSHSDMELNSKGMIPWYLYFVGGMVYTALASWLFAESSPLAWICLLGAPMGFFYGWRGWQLKDITQR